ncbi:MAG: zinc-ribbon domain-containing protein [Clostridia bacterium]|nr:zinc-ribbon domain-containing protein [Clostridia bacterium]
MICKFCGAGIPDGAKFCPKCGQYLGNGFSSEAPDAHGSGGDAFCSAYTGNAADNAPGNGAQTGAPGNGTSDYGAPGNGTPGSGTPGYGAPGNGAPGNGAPGYGAPGYGEPPYGAPGYGAPAYGTPVYGEPVDAGKAKKRKTDRFGGFPMKWHKFLCYFFLWALALVMFYRGSSMATGLQYGLDAPYIYRMFPLLRTFDIPLGLLQIGLAVIGAIAAVSLILQKKRGPKMLTVLFICDAVVTLLLLGYQLLFETDVFVIAGEIRRTLIEVGVTVAMIFIHRAYYKKRAHFFIS